MSEPTLANDLPDHTTANITDRLATLRQVAQDAADHAEQMETERDQYRAELERLRDVNDQLALTLAEAIGTFTTDGGGCSRGWIPTATRDRWRRALHDAEESSLGSPARAQDDGTLTRCCAWPGCASIYRADVGPRERGWVRLRGLAALCPDHTAPATAPATIAAQTPAHPCEGDREGDTIPQAHKAAETARPTITIGRPDDDVIDIYVNGQRVASANHDDHGWTGTDAVEKTALAIARACGARINDGDDDTAHAAQPATIAAAPSAHPSEGDREGDTIPKAHEGAETVEPDACLIWSHHHGTWWGPNGCGYRRDITDAGRYTLADTKQWLGRGCRCCPVPEVVIPAPRPEVLAKPGRTARWVADAVETATAARIERGEVNTWAEQAEG